jgi:hypothetical protein
MQRQARQMRNVVVGNCLGMQPSVGARSCKQCATRPSSRARTAQSYHLRLNDERPLNLRHGSVWQKSAAGLLCGLVLE